jgi:hypothetical protein
MKQGGRPEAVSMGGGTAQQQQRLWLRRTMRTRGDCRWGLGGAAPQANDSAGGGASAPAAAAAAAVAMAVLASEGGSASGSSGSGAAQQHAGEVGGERSRLLYVTAFVDGVCVCNCASPGMMHV